jgi:formylglycine-generating enzyme required for sulfatase activity
MFTSSMIRIPSGTFWMGSDKHFKQECPRHCVFTDAFEISSTTVTRREYECFLDQTQHESPRDWSASAFSDPQQPVVGVNWFDAVAYCEWHSPSSGPKYRLPTEAEWEKACRGGDDDRAYAWGNEAPDTLEYYQAEWLAPRRVAERDPNGYGLYNMGDNVHEWCLDWYSPDYYQASPERNPGGPPSGKRRVSRSGSWRHAVKASRAAHRSSLPPHYRYTDYGFRIARDIDSQ